MTYDYVAPSTTDEAIRLLEELGHDAHVIAGGASVLLMLQQQLIIPRVLVGLRGISGLAGIEPRPDGGIWIGATTTHRVIERSPLVRAYAPALAEAIGQVATVRIRNQGTIGGNLAHADPAQDPPAILLALDATVEVAGPEGTRSLPIEELFVDVFETSLRTAELIVRVVLPPRPTGSRARYLKFLPGSKDDYATVAVAVSGTPQGDRSLTGVRIACGAAGPTPLRIHEAEALVDGRRLDPSVLDQVAEAVHTAVDPIADGRGSAAYKRAMAAVWVRRALESIGADLKEGRGA